MSNNLERLKSELRRLAKRCKNIKYTEGLLLAFLMTGLLTFSQMGVTSPEIKEARQSIDTSISDMKKLFKEAKQENNKLLKQSNLELIQLMEQGDHVVKSPWSSWQFGGNYYYSDWQGTYKGRGDKAEKYPYEGVLTRDETEFNRYVSEESIMYQYLSKSTRLNSAASNAREGLGNYGLASNTIVPEPPVSFEISASIKPRTISKGAIEVPTPAALTPSLPNAIDFNPVTPNIATVTPPTIITPEIDPPGTGNGDTAYIYDGNYTKIIGTNGTFDVAPISQTKMDGGSVDIVVTSANNSYGGSFNLKTNGVKFTGIQGTGHATLFTYNNNINETYNGSYAAFKLVGGHTIDVTGTTINFGGAGLAPAISATNSYRKWLFHTDGHNNRGESTWKLNGTTKVNIDGSYLTMYTSQYHSGTSQNANIGFVNNATIDEKGTSNIIWIGLSEGSNGSQGINRLQYFHNNTNGKLTMAGTGTTLAYIMIPTLSSQPSNDEGGFAYQNDGEITMNGADQNGLIIAGSGDSNKGFYNKSEIRLVKPITIAGTNSNALVFNVWADLDGGTTNFNRSSADNKNDGLSSTLGASSRESILNVDITGNNNRAIYINDSETAAPKTFNIKTYSLNSTDADNNILAYINKGIVQFGTSTVSGGKNEMNITGGKENIALYTSSPSALTTAADITITNSDSSTGIFANRGSGTPTPAPGTVTNTGKVSVSGKSVKAIIANSGTTVTSTGKITVNGTALSATDGAVGLASMNGANVSQTHTDTSITVSDSASIGLYADGKVKTSTAVATGLSMTGGTVTAKGGAFNTYAANNGTVTLNGVTLNTEQKSLAFYTADGKIDFGTGSTKTVANIKGGADSNSRGTAFLYKGSGYSSFNSGTIGSWVSSNFGNMGNLTLNMEDGSRLFIAQDVKMNLSDTGTSSLATSLGGATINGSNYKTFMLYLSKLALNQSINLDNPTDAYNMLEISNSSIDNNNSNTITGTQAGQVAMAQKNESDGSYNNPREKVTLNNEGTISLSGDASTGMYTKFGEIKNAGTGIITVGNNSAAIYATDDSEIINEGVINLGEGSTGIYSEADTAAGKTIAALGPYKGSVLNSKIIQSTGKAIGITYKGTGSGAPSGDVRITNDINGKINLAGEGSVGIYGLGSSYGILNEGEITLGNASNLKTAPNVGIYTSVESVEISNSPTGKITTGNNSIGTYGYNIENSGNITTGDNGIGIYSKRLSTGPSTVTHNSGTITVGNDDATGIFLENGGNLDFSGGTINIGDKSFGIVTVGSDSFTYTNSSASTVNLGNGSMYFYSNNPTTNFTNNVSLNNPTGVGIYGISSPGKIVNDANFTLGDQSVGILYTGTHTDGATNRAAIKVGNSDTENKNYAIGMATKTGKIVNDTLGNITVGNDGIGLFADGLGTTAINEGTITLAGNNSMGMYLDNGAYGENRGTITTGTGTPTGAIGVVVQHKATLKNTSTGVITINSPEGYAFFKATGGIIINEGVINLGNGATETFDPTSKPTSKTTGSVSINAPTGATPATTSITINGIAQPIEQLVINTPEGKVGPSPTSLGIYVNTLGGTNPIQGNIGLVAQEADLILGNEAAKTTTSKNIIVTGAVLDPYIKMMEDNSGITWNAYAGSLTWTATPLYSNGQLGAVVLAKIPYTEYAGNEATPTDIKDTYNFLDGLEQRYGVEAVGTREKQLFDKLNEIGKNEKALFYQATDEMMGHQYANVQQRIYGTGRMLDKEITHLTNEWATKSKESNKIKAFGMRDEYNTDTAGIIDYKSDAYGFAYVHEDETVKLGNTTGWYAGAVHNRIRFKDIGNSKENTTMLKAGVFKSTAFDHNGSLKWTISGEGYVARSNMHRKYLVVDEIFEAKSDYSSYGVAIKNEIGKEFRTSERTSIRPYGSLKLEYGRFSDIEEKSGEVRLEVQGNDYYSIRPEVGVEFKYKQPMAVRTTFVTTLGLGYESELGKVGDVGNKARVNYTTADWFGIRGEKDDRKGNFKADLNIGIENQRFGVTLNAGYDTKGENIRGGIGFRAIY